MSIFAYQKYLALVFPTTVLLNVFIHTCIYIYNNIYIYIYQREKGVVILLPKIVLRNKLIVTIPIRNKFSFIFMPYVSTVLDCLLQRLTADF